MHFNYKTYYTYKVIDIGEYERESDRNITK